MGRPAGTYTHSEETRRRISETQRERAREMRQHAAPHPTTRVCSACGERKSVSTDFYWRRRKLASGGYSTIPMSRCKDCDRQRLKDRKAALTPEQRRALNQHDYALRRRKKSEPRILVDPKPFLEWFDEWLALRGLTEKGFLRHVFGESEGDNMDRAIHRYRNGESPRAEIQAIDRVLVAADMAHLTVLLYPEDER